jgi:hypothetical protein
VVSASRLGAVLAFSRSPGAKGQTEVGQPLLKLKVSYVGSRFRSSCVSPMCVAHSFLASNGWRGRERRFVSLYR